MVGSLSVEKLLNRYHTQIYDQFETRGFRPADKNDEADLNVLRALDSSKNWRRQGQREFARINHLIDKLIAVRDDSSKLVPSNGARVPPHKFSPPRSPPPAVHSQPVATVTVPQWSSNISRYSGTGISYGWGTDYIDALINGFQRGSPSQSGAHVIARNTLMSKSIDITDEDAQRINDEDKKNLTEAERKYFKPLESGSYIEIPQKSRGACETKFGSDSEVLIVTGAEKQFGPIGFSDEAQRLKTTLEKRFGAHVHVVSQPDEEALRSALTALGGGKHLRHAAVYFIGHGGEVRQLSPEQCRKGHYTYAQAVEGTFWSQTGKGGDLDITEDQVKKLLAETLAPRCDKIDLVMSACHSQVWID